MSSFAEDSERRVIPRWREALKTISGGELAPVEEGPTLSVPTETFLNLRLAEWRSEKTMAVAADLLSAGVALGMPEEVEAAARFIADNQGDAPAPCVTMATHLLSRKTREAPASLEDEDSAELKALQEQVRRLRARLRAEPRDPYSWVDLSRAYAALGEDAKALRAIRGGLRTAPDSRFVLRSASRLLVHTGAPDEAHMLLRRSQRTSRDPWLAAAEIAVAAVAHKSPLSVKAGKRLLESKNFSPFQTAELASALGMLDLERGRTRFGKRFLAQALVEPNDNTVAQVAWASRKFGIPKVSNTVLRTPRSFEARAWGHYVAGEWQAALDQSWSWFVDEPFSTRPLVLGSYVAATELEDYEKAAMLARRGLKTDPSNGTLLNNLAFALTNSGDLNDAAAVLRSIESGKLSNSERVACSATSGLLQFRMGNYERGRGLYSTAIELAGRPKEARLRALAMAYWAREEILAGSDSAKNTFGIAVKELSIWKGPTTALLQRRLEQLYSKTSATGGS